MRSLSSLRRIPPYFSMMLLLSYYLDFTWQGQIDNHVLKVLNNPGAIEGPVQEVLKIKEKTEAALEKGDIKLPKNNDKVKVFKEMDEQFHVKLKNLIALSRRGDKKGMQNLTHELLNGCIGCHEKFRQ